MQLSLATLHEEHYLCLAVVRPITRVLREAEKVSICLNITYNLFKKSNLGPSGDLKAARRGSSNLNPTSFDLMLRICHIRFTNSTNLAVSKLPCIRRAATVFTLKTSGTSGTFSRNLLETEQGKLTLSF